ncbi:hypothetical protein [Cyanobium sp. WAJ14-Wanaka]|uniref:hypothetical protein n=1 Tax=Cyanobium sp. WAJ14-Wanaka TaxID=2823725 RepID=UPI0020CD7F7D|nr:hypothetical protein [Cyanobium sp. WAJ14-Wanaka]MCP9774783.1 hypothetical protein [Cyanobium sp. WAJ14-Wanaka]
MTSQPRFRTALLGASVLGVSLLGSFAGLPVGAGRAQDLVGCQIVDGLLSCVPGVSPQPAAQIKALRSEIASDIQLEGAVQQQINGLNQLVLAGQAVQGQILAATINADLLASLPPGAFHWYSRQPGASNWILIQGASGPTYVLSASDVSNQVMLVVAQPTATGSQRQASPAVGPIQPANSL